MLNAKYSKYNLLFNSPATTSRAIMQEKETFFIKIWDTSNPNIYGIGECAIFRGLSAEDNSNYENTLKTICENIRPYMSYSAEAWNRRFSNLIHDNIANLSLAGRIRTDCRMPYYGFQEMGFNIPDTGSFVKDIIVYLKNVKTSLKRKENRFIWRSSITRIRKSRYECIKINNRKFRI